MKNPILAVFADAVSVRITISWDMRKSVQIDTNRSTLLNLWPLNHNQLPEAKRKMSVSIANQNKQTKGLISVSVREIFLTQFFRENEILIFSAQKIQNYTLQLHKTTDFFLKIMFKKYIVFIQQHLAQLFKKKLFSILSRTIFNYHYYFTQCTSN